MTRNRSFTIAAATMACSIIAVIATAPPVLAGDYKAFYYGTDSGGPTPASSPVPYSEPSPCSGAYGGYLGKIGGADLITSSNPKGYGPGNTYAWVPTAAKYANINHFTYTVGAGTSGFWYMYGPQFGGGVGPYNLDPPNRVEVKAG